jgi:hypothetical protein
MLATGTLSTVLPRTDMNVPATIETVAIARPGLRAGDGDVMKRILLEKPNA